MDVEEIKALAGDLHNGRMPTTTKLAQAFDTLLAEVARLQAVEQAARAVDADKWPMGTRPYFVVADDAMNALADALAGVGTPTGEG